MNINEILFFPNIDPKTIRGVASFDEGLYNTWIECCHGYKEKPIPFDLKTVVFKNISKLDIFAFENDNKYPAIYLGLCNYYDGFRVDNVRVEPSLRGHHYGMKLYLAVVKNYNKPLYSGAMQTTASNNAIWKKLIEIYPDKVVGFDQKTKSDLQLKVTSRGPVVNDKEPVYKNIKITTYNPKYKDEIRTRLLKLLP
jgi:hypothetical protein